MTDNDNNEQEQEHIDVTLSIYFYFVVFDQSTKCTVTVCYRRTFYYFSLYCPAGKPGLKIFGKIIYFNIKYFNKITLLVLSLY